MEPELPTAEAEACFQRWFAAPFKHLETMLNGDGAFVAFAVSLALYERYAKSLLIAAKQPANGEGIKKQLAADLKIPLADADEFWHIMRDGMQHQAMPQQKDRGNPLTPWLFEGGFPLPVQFGTNDTGQRVLCVQPWLFCDFVVNLYRARPEVLHLNKSYPWASIFPVLLQSVEEEQ